MIFSQLCRIEDNQEKLWTAFHRAQASGVFVTTDDWTGLPDFKFKTTKELTDFNKLLAGPPDSDPKKPDEATKRVRNLAVSIFSELNLSS